MGSEGEWSAWDSPSSFSTGTAANQNQNYNQHQQHHVGQYQHHQRQTATPVDMMGGAADWNDTGAWATNQPPPSTASSYAGFMPNPQDQQQQMPYDALSTGGERSGFGGRPSQPSSGHGVQPGASYYGAGYGPSGVYTNPAAPTDPYQFAGAIPAQLLSDPMMNAARQYGEQFAEQQKEKISQYLSTYRLKYYFAVDHAYVAKKLGLLLFPFAHRDWALKYSSEEPVPARFDVNAPDLYIPLMAFLTYVLLAGFVIGTQGRFSPEELGRLTSNAMAWLIVENIVVLVSKYLLNISQALSFWHTLAFSSYKFVGMIVCLLVFLIAGRTAYYCALAYCSLAIAFFLIRSVKTFVLDVHGSHDGGTKRKLYLLLFISLTQPFIMWWLTGGVAQQQAQMAKMAGMGLGAGMAGKLGQKAAGGPKRALNPDEIKAALPPGGEVDYEALLAKD